MQILLLNQCFYPDHVATAQYLTDLAKLLIADGHEVTVLSSSRSYDRPKERFLSQEVWNKIKIHRIWTPGLGKSTMLHRIVDALVFWLNAMRRLMLLPRHDVIISLTSPPLISALGAAIARLKNSRSMIWLMDMNPDQAIINGVLRKGTISEKFLSWVLNWSFKNASKIMVLDRFMKERLLAKGIDDGSIFIIPPWSHDDAVKFDMQERIAFRKLHGLDDKFVVMYSGNHSPCHPLDSVLEAAHRLRDNITLHFLFVGGGVEYKKVQDFAAKHNLNNISLLPYQPLDSLSASLSSADLHLVVMGDPYVGIVHPCKIYNILSLGIPFLFVGPTLSHISDISAHVGSSDYARHAPHGDIEGICDHLMNASRKRKFSIGSNLQKLAEDFSYAHLGAKMVAEITN